MIEELKPHIKKALHPRNIVRYIVRGSTYMVVTTAVNTLTDPEDKLDKAKIFVGSNVLAMIVSDYAVDYVDEQIDASLSKEAPVEETAEVPEIAETPAE